MYARARQMLAEALQAEVEAYLAQFRAGTRLEDPTGCLEEVATTASFVVCDLLTLMMGRIYVPCSTVSVGK
jgi:hypothetical protein